MIAQEVLCKSCGKSIPEERLEAIPETQHCVECSSERRKLYSMEGDENYQVLVEVPYLEKYEDFENV